MRVVNLITKKKYRGSFLQELGGTTTEGGDGTNFVEFNTTRIDGPRRLSLNAAYLREFPLLESQRRIAPNVDTPFSVGGNVGSLDGGSIDPALDQLAGLPVTVAAIPSDPELRRLLTAYAVNPNRPGFTDIRSFRSLQDQRDTARLNGTVAGPIGAKIDGSLNLSMESVRAKRLNGIAQARLTVPGSSNALPFSNDVFVYRTIPEAILRQRNNTLTLHAGATLQGGLGQWAWDATSAFDQVRNFARSQQGLQLDQLQMSVDGGGDPLTPIDLRGAAWLVDRSNTITNSWINKVVATGPVLRLPAGNALLTVSLDHATSSSSEEGSGGFGVLKLSRTIQTGSVNAVIPIASASNGTLPFLGTLSMTGMIGTSHISDYGQLTSFTYGMNWKPVEPLQLSASLNDARAAPDIALLTGAILVTPNRPFFVFSSGDSVLVTTIGGGNPALRPERRRVASFTTEVRPLRGRQLQLGISYLDTRIDNQSAALGGATTAFQAAYPARFVRDPSGTLTSVDLRPVNVAQEYERKIRATVNFSTSIGRKPKSPPEGVNAAGNGESLAKPPPPLPTIAIRITTTWRLENRLRLRPDLPSLDLLNGGTLTGIGGRPKWESQINLSGTIGPVGFGVVSRLQGPTRVSSDIAASDLHFSGRTWMVPYGSLDVEQLIQRPWARSITLNLTVENALNNRIKVRDRNGVTPYRFQSAFIDPLGRSIRVGVRKVF